MLPLTLIAKDFKPLLCFVFHRLVQSKEMSAVAAAGVEGLTLQGTGQQSSSSSRQAAGPYAEEAVQAVEECKYGFDERELFQVSGELPDNSQQYWSSLQEKRFLRDQFKHK